MRTLYKRISDYIKYHIYIPIQNNIFYFVPIKRNKIVFDNFEGNGYGCNPKYIANALCDLDTEHSLDLVWLVKDDRMIIPERIRRVKYDSITAAYELSTAQVWVDNVRGGRKVRKKKQQFYIQTWHGSIGMKKSEQEVEEFLPINYVKAAKHDGRITDLMISNGKYRSERFHNNFWYNGQILECGFPRNDILVNKSESVKKQVYESLHLQQDRKIILYAPTFRLNTVDSDDPIAPFRFDYDLFRKEAERRFGGHYVFLLRLHPVIAKDSNLFRFSDTIVNATDYPDIQELLAFSDILITDYSSCMFDSMIAKNKVFLLTKDLNEYVRKERGLLFDFKKLPCSLAEKESELLANLSEFNEEEYYQNCDEFFEEIGFHEPGNASYTVAKLILSKTKENSEREEI